MKEKKEVKCIEEKKLVIDLYDKLKKREMQNINVQLYNKFKDAGFILKPIEIKEVKKFTNIRELLYTIAKQNAKITYSEWKKLIKIHDQDLYQLCLEYPIFLNRIDDKAKLVDVLNYMSKEEIEKIRYARGLKVTIKCVLTSYNRFLNNDNNTFLKNMNEKAEVKTIKNISLD